MPARQVTGFTLASRGILAGPLRRALPWEGVHAVGRDAVMIRDEESLAERDEVAVPSELREGNTLGGRVLAEGGIELGTIEDLILDVGASAAVVGYQIRTSGALLPAGRTAFLPSPADVAISGESLVVPADVSDLVVNDVAALSALLRTWGPGTERKR